jgi:hypothetical protein
MEGAGRSLGLRSLRPLIKAELQELSGIPYRDKNYQLDFVTPGIIPAEASSRKVMREILNRRM